MMTGYQLSSMSTAFYIQWNQSKLSTIYLKKIKLFYKIIMNVSHLIVTSIYSNQTFSLKGG